MRLFINDILKKEEPSHLDLKTALYPLTETLGTNLNYEVRLEKSSAEWISAKWDNSVGIALSYKPDSSSPILNDSELFISQKRTIYLFQHFAKGIPIDSDVKWNKQQNQLAVKTFLYKYGSKLQNLFLILTIGIILFTLYQFNTYRNDDTLNDFLGNNLYLFAQFLIFGGFFGISHSYIFFAYRNEIEDDINDFGGYFLFSSFFSVIGIFLLIAQWF